MTRRQQHASASPWRADGSGETCSQGCTHAETRMPSYIVRRLLLLVPVLFGHLALTFLLAQLVPGDIVSIMLGTRSTPQAKAALAKLFGLDQPIYVQYCYWLADVLRGDLGTSLQHGPTGFE